MTAAAWVALALAGVLAVGNWAALTRGSTAGEYILKPATMLALLAAAVVLDPADPVQRAWFVAALGLGLAGDVFLMLGARMFVPGLAAFLAGHVAYTAGFARAIASPGLLVAVALVVGIAATVIGARLVAAVGQRDSRLRMPVVAYIAVISIMVATGVATASAWAIFGAAMFYVSDLGNGWRRFVRDRPAARLLVRITYHLGQAGLVRYLVG